MNTRVLASLLLAFLLSGCYIGPSRVAVNPTPVLTPVYTILPFTPKNTGRAVELARFGVERKAPVAAIAFTPDGQELLAVYGREGTLRRWRVADGAQLAALDIGPVGMAAVSFDSQARKVAVGGGKTSIAVKAGYNANLRGVRLWDTQTGKLIFEFEPDLEEVYADVALSPDGHRLVGVGEGALTRWDATTGEYVCGSAYMGSEDIRTGEHIKGSSLLDAVTFDPTGELLAYATESGSIGIEKWDNSGRNLCSGNYVGEIRPEKNPLGVPLALSIDPTRHWLAAVMGQSLEVRDMQLGQVALSAKVAEGALAGLAFSPDGTLLAVGTAGGWKIWSVDKKQLLIEKADQPTFSVTFSPDGRLFAWGDAEGVVHVWGVSEK